MPIFMKNGKFTTYLQTMPDTSWGLLCVLAMATVLRIWKIGVWSLWEDEETTLYFSQHLTAWFPSMFPFFFRMLQGLFHVWGISVEIGRGLAAAFGVLSIWVFYELLHKLWSRRVAFWACLFLSINLGHMFWSQSVRYYTCVLFFQLLSMYWFMNGFERRKTLSLLLSIAAFIAALLTHYSAVLLLPVYIGYVVLMMWCQESEGYYGLKGYLVFFIPLLIVLVVYSADLMQWTQGQYFLDIPSIRSPAIRTYTQYPEISHLLMTVVAYFGVPLVGLGLLGATMARQVSRRGVLFFGIVGVIPILELVVITYMHLSITTWYYALFALTGFAALAAISLDVLYQGGYRRISIGFGSATVLYYLVFLGLYYTSMHGDRPRWQEAVNYLKHTAGVSLDSGTHAQIFATVPGTVAFYLGVNPAKTMGHPSVHRVPDDPPEGKVEVEQWYIVKASHVSKRYATWFNSQCQRKARFPAHTGPIDRSTLVYHCWGQARASKR
jgi:hypothetical protein